MILKVAVCLQPRLSAVTAITTALHISRAFALLLQMYLSHPPTKRAVEENLAAHLIVQILTHELLISTQVSSHAEQTISQ